MAKSHPYESTGAQVDALPRWPGHQQITDIERRGHAGRVIGNSRQTGGLTLIEVLVVITIIGILVALLLPAVQAAREASRQAACKNNLKQIGISLLSYHDVRSVFPALLISPSDDNPQKIAQGDKRANWLVMLLPYLEQNSIHDQWNFDLPASENSGRSVDVSLFKCPSDTYNVGNFCSFAGGGWARGNYGLNVAPCTHNSQSKTNGTPSPLGGIGAANFSVGIQQITDGTSHTVAVDELRAGLNPDDLRGCWAMPGLGSGTGALFQDAGVPNPRGAHSDDMENRGAAGFEGDSSEGMGCYDPGQTSQMAARSMHPTGVYVLFVDGSVHFVSNDIEGNTTAKGTPQSLWQALHTRGGAELLSGF